MNNLNHDELELIAEALTALENLIPNDGVKQQRIRDLADKVISEQAAAACAS